MNFALLIKLLPYLPQIGSLIPIVQRIISRGFSINGIIEDLKELNNAHLLDWLKATGESFFPAVRDELKGAAGAITYAPDYVMKVQKLLNQVVSPSPGLDVDGLIGPKTKTAVAAYQQAKGLVVDGFPGDNTMAALQADAVKIVPVKLGGEGAQPNTVVAVFKEASAAVNPLPAGVPAS